MEKTSVECIQNIAEGLKDLNEHVVFVGGAVCGLYATDSAAQDARPTNDVDCVVEVMSYHEHAVFEEKLRQHHFTNDIRPSAPICRWVYKDIVVDIMPDDEDILGFSNRWYRPGFKNKEPYQLPSGKIIYILPVTYYIASKLDAVLSRGGSDLRVSHDFEDIVYVLNYCPEFRERCLDEDPILRDFLKKQFASLLKRANIREEIECVLPYGEEDRVDIIMSILAEV